MNAMDALANDLVELRCALCAACERDFQALRARVLLPFRFGAGVAECDWLFKRHFQVHVKGAMNA